MNHGGSQRGWHRGRDGGGGRREEKRTGRDGIYWKAERTNDVRRGKRALEDKKQDMSYRPIASIGCQHFICLLLPAHSRALYPHPATFIAAVWPISSTRPGLYCARNK